MLLYALLMSPFLSVVLPYWFDRPDSEAFEIAENADRLGFPRLWVGEMATFDAFALGASIASRTSSIELVIGPVAAGVRSPVALSLGLLTVEAAGDRAAQLALGASSPEIVSSWHGREWGAPVSRIRETFEATSTLLRGDRLSYDGSVVKSRGFRPRSAARCQEIALAALGPRSLSLAARSSKLVVFNLLTHSAAAWMCSAVCRHAKEAGIARRRICLWQTVALEPTEETLRQIAAQLSAYLAAPGYGEMFTAAGGGELVERARKGESRSALAALITPDFLSRFVAWGDADAVKQRLDDLFEAGIDEIAVVPATAPDRGGEATLSALAALYS